MAVNKSCSAPHPANLRVQVSDRPTVYQPALSLARYRKQRSRTPSEPNTLQPPSFLQAQTRNVAALGNALSATATHAVHSTSCRYRYYTGRATLRLSDSMQCGEAYDLCQPIRNERELRVSEKRGRKARLLCAAYSSVKLTFRRRRAQVDQGRAVEEPFYCFPVLRLAHATRRFHCTARRW